MVNVILKRIRNGKKKNERSHFCSFFFKIEGKKNGKSVFEVLLALTYIISSLTRISSKCKICDKMFKSVQKLVLTAFSPLPSSLTTASFKLDKVFFQRMSRFFFNKYTKNNLMKELDDHQAFYIDLIKVFSHFRIT